MLLANSQPVEHENEITPRDGGFAVLLTNLFPFADIETVAPKVPVLVDTDNDGSADHQIIAALHFEDVDNDGVIERGTDILFIKPVHAEVILPGVALSVDAEDREYVARRIVSKLAGVNRVRFFASDSSGGH